MKWLITFSIEKLFLRKKEIQLLRSSPIFSEEPLLGSVPNVLCTPLRPLVPSQVVFFIFLNLLTFVLVLFWIMFFILFLLDLLTLSHGIV